MISDSFSLSSAFFDPRALSSRMPIIVKNPYLVQNLSIPEWQKRIQKIGQVH